MMVSDFVHSRNCWVILLVLLEPMSKHRDPFSHLKIKIKTSSRQADTEPCIQVLAGTKGTFLLQFSIFMNSRVIFLALTLVPKEKPSNFIHLYFYYFTLLYFIFIIHLCKR